MTYYQVKFITEVTSSTEKAGCSVLGRYDSNVRWWRVISNYEYYDCNTCIIKNLVDNTFVNFYFLFIAWSPDFPRNFYSFYS